MPDRSTGVQQGAYERGVEDGWAWARGGPEPEGVGAVSPEPRCSSVAPFSAGGPLRCELAAGHEGEHYNAGTSSGYWSDREGEQEEEMREGERAGEGSLSRGGGPCCAAAADGQLEVPPSPAGSPAGSFTLTGEAAVAVFRRTATPPPGPSVARELRLTASRLRDPEYRWSVDPAVTLEHLAERLEGNGEAK